MPIVGLNFRDFEAKRTEDIAGSIRLSTNMNITNVKEQDLPLLKTKGITIEFEFKTDYTNEKDKSIGKINILGDVVFIGDDTEKILKEWKKDKKLPDVVRFQVVRLVTDKCSKKAIVLSDDLQLPPPPLMMPQAKIEEK